MGKKLNLKWVAEAIGDNYKKWNKGDIILLQSQTGTGKTWFIKNVLIDYIEDFEKVLLVCNRTNLKRQLKNDLLKKYGLEVPETIEELDKITTIENIVITSYHAIQYSVFDRNYGLGKSDLSNFDYIILDECHYILTDGSFNNQTRFAYEELIRTYHKNSIKIFISATMDELIQPIYNHLNKLLGYKPNVFEYSTGVDYSYINTSYFKNIKDIIATIQNDKSDDKWLIFVSNINDAGKIKEAIGDDCSIIKSGTTEKENDELSSIINNSRFEKKVLVTTKALDNGINIDDKQVKHIVIMAWDRTTFIQMLGRKRIDIEDAQTVNLYISTRYKKSFLKKIFEYDKKKKEIELYRTDRNLFNRKYDNDLKSIGKLSDLFYKEKEGKSGKWKINPVGNYRLHQDLEFAKYMVEKFKLGGNFVFANEQLSWLGLGHTFCESNLIENVILKKEVEKLEDYLEKLVGQKLFDKEQKELTKKIMGELLTISQDIDYRTKKIKPSTLEKILRDDLSLFYAISGPKRERSKKSENLNQRYITILKLEK